VGERASERRGSVVDAKAVADAVGMSPDRCVVVAGSALTSPGEITIFVLVNV
jgi:hypothetical protein